MHADAVHRMHFDSDDAAIAFIAALSRYLAGPDVTALNAEVRDARVWVSTTAGSPMKVYLSDEALRATQDRFGTPPRVVRDVWTNLPRQSRLLIGVGPIAAWGEADVRRVLFD